MSKKPLVSVIINSYNYAHFIQRAIDSALGQTYPSEKMEIMVIDDGSTDDTSQTIKKYGDKIKYIYKQNGGQASAFNTGFEHSTGEYIVLLDADDACYPGRVERVVSEFEKYKDVGCVLNTRTIVTEKGVINESFPEFHDIHLDRSNLKLIKKSKYGTSRTAIRRSVVEKILPVPEKDLIIEADLYLNLAVIWFGNLSCINEELTYYNVHGSNLFSITNHNKLPLQIKSMRVALECVREKVAESELYNKQMLDYLLEPYDIEILEKEAAFDIHNSKATRKQIINIELRKLGQGWNDWGIKRKIYKLITLPLYLLLSPALSAKFKRYYSDHNLNQITEKLTT